jgi:urea transport system substrate-binding protein
LDGRLAGETYVPLGSKNVANVVTQITNALPKGGVIYNTLNGDSNLAFFKQLHEVGLGSDKYSCMSVSIAEEEVKAIGVQYLKGHYAAWNYFQTIDTPENKKFVAAFQQKYGRDRVLSDPMESAYIMVYLWKQAVEKAGVADNLEKVRKAALGQSMIAPQGKITLEKNHHLSKAVRIGQVRDDGLFDIVYDAVESIKPLPWNQYLAESNGYSCDWSDLAKGGKYK